MLVAVRKHVRTTAAALVVVGASTVMPARTASAAVTVDGAGSTWSQIAVDQWRADIAGQGITINYQGVGSTSGRVFWYNGQTDFAVSEIPFQAEGDGGINEIAKAQARGPFAYLPIVAGGTSFMYHLEVGGQRLTDLRLSPRTIAKVFTGVIRTWDHADITADNKGRKLPALPIKVVTRSDGSGTSAQFTAFMASQTPGEWQAFCQVGGLGSNCRATSLYPNPPGLGFVPQQFSDGVANFVAAPYNNGAITYVEYGYAKERGYPVASVLNKAGYFTQPKAPNVSIALRGAAFNSDNTQNLNGVYTNPDPNAYPVSSYSYMIVPTSESANFTAEKGDSLGKFILYFVCAGQQKAEQLGYAPLPKVLVQNGFEAVKKIPGAPAPPAIDSCRNPTIDGTYNPNPPPPLPDDKNGPPTTAPSQGNTATTNGNGDGNGNSNGNANGGTSTTVFGDVTEETFVDADGNVVTEDGTPVFAQPIAYASPVDYPAGDDPLPLAVYILASIMVIVVVFGPPLLALFLRRQRPAP
jgi:phosphate ABC transporter phosphate-binding protein